MRIHQSTLACTNNNATILVYRTIIVGASLVLRGRLQAEHDLDAIVHHDHNGATHTTEELGDEALVHACGTLGLQHLEEAVNGALVETLGGWLLGLEHHATTHGVEGVVEGHHGRTGSGGGTEGGDNTNHALVLVPWVEALDLAVETELTGAVHEGTRDRGPDATVETTNTLLLHGLHDAVHDAVEGLLGATDVGSEAGTGKVHGVADDVSRGTGATAGHEVGSHSTPEVGLAIVLRENTLDGIVQRKRGTLLGSVAQAVDEVTTPERGNTLLGGNATAAVGDAGVPGHLTRDNLGVGVLGLHQDLDALHRRHDGLDEGARDTTDGQVDEKA